MFAETDPNASIVQAEKKKKVRFITWNYTGKGKISVFFREL